MTFVLAIDQGTSATKAILVNTDGAVVAHGSAPLGQSHLAPGWVEQDPAEIAGSVCDAVAACLSGHDAARVAAVGISNQRETLLLWERETGAPLGPALSWQDQRTIAGCQKLRADGAADLVRQMSGLPLDPMFSAAKATWLLDRYDPGRVRSSRGDLCLGTVDTWLLSRWGGRHLVEVGNASRTQLLDIRRQEWAPDLLALFRVPVEVLPDVVPSTGPFPDAVGLPMLGRRVPVTAVLGDSHAALFAHGGWRPGLVKTTYGTGSSVMGLTDAAETTPDGLCLTIAWNTGQPAYAVEGNIRSTGATLTWLGKLLSRSPGQVAELAATASSDGVHLVPAFGGLGAPWWDDGAVGLLCGLTLGTSPAQVARAALESIAFQVEDVVAAVDAHAGHVDTLLADGGPTTNPILMQVQADTSGRMVECAELSDLSALGAAHLAGLSCGIWSWRELAALPRPRRQYHPQDSEESRHRRIAAWHKALARSRFAG